MDKLFKKILPHLIAVAVFLGVTIIYFYPQFAGKTTEKRHDTQQWAGSAQEIVQYGKDHQGEATLWTNSMFGGMPSYQILTSYPGNKITHLSNLMFLHIPNPAGSIILMLLSFYILMLTFKVDRWLAVLGSFAYAFSTYNFINLEAGHETKVFAVGFAPLVLAAVNLAFRGNWFWAFIMGIVGVGLQINANHLQITYYLLFIVGAWGIAEFISAIRNKTLNQFFKGCAGVALGAVIGVGLNLTNLLLTEEYSKYTIRAKSELTNKEVKVEETGGLDFGYATQWSNGVLEPITILIPDAFGGASNGELGKGTKTYKFLQQQGLSGPELEKQSSSMPVYHGEQPFTSGAIYFGAIICFLCVLGLFVIKAEMRWALFGISILAFLLSMGKNLPGLSHMFFDYFPLYNKFRAVTMMMVVGQICFPILAFLALKEVFYGNISKEKLKQYLIYSLGIVGGICFLFVALPSLFLSFNPPADARYGFPPEFLQLLMDDRESLTRISAFRSLILIALTFGALWMLLLGKTKKEYALVTIAGLIVFDFVSIDRRYIQPSDFKFKKSAATEAVNPSPADLEILKDPELDYRVLSFDVSPFNDATVSYFHKNVGGYHGAKFRRYQELREAYFDQPIGIVQGNMAKLPVDYLLDTLRKSGQMEIFNMMNTKYFIANGTAVPNPYRYGNAWLADEICWVKNADQEIDTLNGVDLKHTAVINEAQFKDRVGGYTATAPDSSASIKLASYQPNHLVYNSSSQAEKIAVFSEVFYDNGWKVTIDNQPAQQFRVNYVLRGLKLPAGNHKIEFSFDPDTYKTGQTIAYICSALLYLSLIFGIYTAAKQVMKAPEEKVKQKK